LYLGGGGGAKKGQKALACFCFLHINLSKKAKKTCFFLCARCLPARVCSLFRSPGQRLELLFYTMFAIRCSRLCDSASDSVLVVCDSSAIVHLTAFSLQRDSSAIVRLTATFDDIYSRRDRLTQTLKMKNVTKQDDANTTTVQ